MRPKGKSTTKIKLDLLSDSYDRLKRDYMKLDQQYAKLQNDFDNLARVKVYQLLDVLHHKVHELEPKDYPQVTRTDLQNMLK